MVHIAQAVFEEKANTIRFTPAIDKKAVVSKGQFYDQRSVSRNSEIWVAELPAGNAFVAVDLNANGEIETGERFRLTASRMNANDLEAIVRLHITNPLYKTYPIFIQYKRGFKHPKLMETDRPVLQSTNALAYGTVDIDDHVCGSSTHMSWRGRG